MFGPRRQLGGAVVVAWWWVIGPVLVGVAAMLVLTLRTDRRVGTPTQRATYQALHTASLAAPPLRSGLDHDSAGRTVALLRSLLGTDGVVVAGDGGRALAASQVDAEHVALLAPVLAESVASGRSAILGESDLACGSGFGPGSAAGAGCPQRAGVVVPIRVEGSVVGALAALDWTASAGLLRLAGEVAGFVGSQLALGELDRSRRAAELGFLRAQISPHFLYNSLAAVESFVRTDPDRARELLVGFAELVRYSFSSQRQFVTLAEELQLVDTYLDLERARSGDGLDVSIRVAPAALGISVPALILQPIVENAVRHGLDPVSGGELSITVTQSGGDVQVSVRDNGAGADRAALEAVLAGTANGGGVGLRNVDDRLRTLFGPGYGLVVKTAPGRGTTVVLRIPASRGEQQPAPPPRLSAPAGRLAGGAATVPA